MTCPAGQNQTDRWGRPAETWRNDMTDLQGTASTPGVETNANLGKNLGAWVLQARPVVYQGLGHMALSMHIADGDSGCYDLSWAHDLAWTHLRCIIKNAGEIVATVELDARNLLRQLADVGFKALEFAGITEPPTESPSTLEQHLLKLHEVLGTTGAEEDFDPYAAVAASQRMLEQFLHAESASSYLTSPQQALLNALVAAGWVTYQYARNPEDVPGNERHSVVITRPGQPADECLLSTDEFAETIAALAVELATVVRWEGDHA